MKFFKMTVLFLALALFAPMVNIYGAENYWYVKRNPFHKQPVCEPNLAYIEDFGGLYVDKSHGDDSSEKVIYLTFDAGYENGNVEKIMDVLKEEGIKGSFFILGNLIERNPELVKRMAEEGHLVCNHTVNHRNLTCADEEKFKAEVEGLEKMYNDLTGKKMSKYFRPPEGTFSENLLKIANKLGYKTVFWSFAYADWDNGAQMGEEAAIKKILDNIHNGEIMLLHPTSATNAKIMKRLIGELKQQGYRFATLDEL